MESARWRPPALLVTGGSGLHVNELEIDLLCILIHVAHGLHT